jgi:hypothetical protein
MKNIKRVSVFGYEGYYEVTENGDIFSIRTYYNKQKKTSRKVDIKLKSQLDKKGYYVQGFSVNNKFKLLQVHRIVWEAFFGKIKEGMQINHIDGNKTNNNLNNLEVVTPKENTQHAWRNGLSKKVYGRQTSNCILDFEQVKQIRKLYQDGKKQTELSEMFGVHQTNIHYIVKGKTRIYA